MRMVHHYLKALIETFKLLKLFLLQILPDDIPEIKEQFTVSFTSVVGNAVFTAPQSTVVTIAANDDQHGVIVFDSSLKSTVYIDEDQTKDFTLSVLRQAGAFGQVRMSKFSNHFCLVM